MKKGLVELGDVVGRTTIDLNKGNYFQGVLTGNAELHIVNGDAGEIFFVDLTQDAIGGYEVTFGGGISVRDPSGYLAQMFLNTSPGAESIGMWSTDGADAVAMGYNATPA